MVELNPKYKQILTTDKRYVIITGGRGSGKSFAISTIANLITYEKKNRILYSRYTLVSAEISIIPEFEEKLELLNVASDFQVRKNQIENLKTGSDILFRGIKSSSGNLTANLKSLKGVSVWIVEEAEELVEEDVFDKVDYSIRSADARNLIVLILNPTTIEHWIWKRFFEKSMKYEYVDGYKVPISTHPEVLHIHTTYMDNLDNLSPSFLNQVDRLREEFPDKYHKVMLGGWRENDEGSVYKNWVEGHFDTNLPYCYGLDFGYYPDPLALIKVAVDHKKKKVYLQEKIYETELSNDEIKAQVTKSIDRMTDLIACDHEKKTVAELKRHGLNVKLAKKGKVSEEITALQDYQFVVDYNSNELKRELRLYHWNDKKASIPIDDYNHLCFVGETLVDTSDGFKEIRDIKVGDCVLTSDGYKEVVSFFDNGTRKVSLFLMRFDTFSVFLECTKDHLIKTDEGWIQISNITKGMTVFLSKNFLEENTTYIKTKDISVKPTSDCIGLYGSIIMAKYLKAITYIILMAIPLIMIYLTYSLLKALNICALKCVGVSMRTLNTLGIVSPMQENTLIFGMGVKRVSNFIRDLQKYLGKKEERMTWSVRYVARNTKHIFLRNQNTAIITARLKRFERGEERKERVYDLGVLGKNEYFADGVLVHNCDAMRYAFNELKKTRKLGLKFFN